jgi:hypothetical protein
MPATRKLIISSCMKIQHRASYKPEFGFCEIRKKKNLIGS